MSMSMKKLLKNGASQFLVLQAAASAFHSNLNPSSFTSQSVLDSNLNANANGVAAVGLVAKTKSKAESDEDLNQIQIHIPESVQSQNSEQNSSEDLYLDQNGAIRVPSHAGNEEVMDNEEHNVDEEEETFRAQNADKNPVQGENTNDQKPVPWWWFVVCAVLCFLMVYQCFCWFEESENSSYKTLSAVGILVFGIAAFCFALNAMRLYSN